MQDFCLHIHTPRCGHADPSIWDADIAQLFYNAGFKTIAFTDHNPWKNLLDNFPRHGMKWEQKEEYLDSIHKLKEQYKGKMYIIAGFEMEYIPFLKDEMEELKEISEFTIVGQHFTLNEKNDVFSIHKKEYVPSDFELDSYASCLEEACRDGYARIVAHPDLYMFHKSEFGKKETEIAERICKAAVKYNVPLEINLDRIWNNTFLKQYDISYPRKEFWQVAVDYKDLKVVYGLDFHGYINPASQDELIVKANDIIGKELIDSLHFCTIEEFF